MGCPRPRRGEARDLRENAILSVCYKVITSLTANFQRRTGRHRQFLASPVNITSIQKISPPNMDSGFRRNDRNSPDPRSGQALSYAFRQLVFSPRASTRSPFTPPLPSPRAKTRGPCRKAEGRRKASVSNFKTSSRRSGRDEGSRRVCHLFSAAFSTAGSFLIIFSGNSQAVFAGMARSYENMNSFR